MSRAIIADDEPLLRAELRERLGLWWPELEIVAEAADGWAAVAAVTQHQPEVVFLDVSMPRLDGMGAAQQLRQQGFAGEIVFVTAYDQYAVRAFEQRALDYLVKPLEDARLRDTITRLQGRLGRAPTTDTDALLKHLQTAIDASVTQALGQHRTEATDALPWVRATRGKQIQLIPFEDIACLRAVPGYTQITTRQGEALITEPLKKLLERLDPRCFVQVHRAAIVNLHFVARIRRDRPGHFVVELKDGLGELETSRARAEFFRDL